MNGGFQVFSTGLVPMDLFENGSAESTFVVY
jgi:hypothetical protein